MDLFTLMGKIAIDSGDSHDEIDGMIEKANTLQNTLNGTSSSSDTASKTIVTSAAKAATGASKSLSAIKVALGNLATQGFNKVMGYGKDFFQTGFEYNQNMEKWTASFKTYLNNNMEAADEFMKRLQQFAIDTPLSMQDVVQEATNLLGAGFDVNDVISALWQIGDLSKGDNAIFTRVARAYWQGMGKPHLNMQDANQMVEVGVPIWQIIADYFNATAREGKTDWTKDFVSNLGTWNKEIPGFEHEMVTNEEFRDAITMATSENGKFYNAMLNLMDTEYGAAQKMLDNYEITAGAFTNAIFEVFKSDTIPALNEILQQLNEWATTNPDALKSLGEAFSNFATTGLQGLLDGLTGLIDFWNEHQGAFQLMTAILGGLLMVTGHPAAGLAMLIASEASGTEELEKVYKNEDGSYRTSILFPGMTEQMNASLPKDDKEAGRYHYFSETARAVAESLWDMQRLGLTGTDVSGFESLMTQVYSEFGKIATELGVEDTEYGVTSLLTDLVQQMMTLDKTKENLPDDWFYDPDKVEPATDWMLRRTPDPGEFSADSNNIPNLIASLQSLVPQIRSEVAAGAQEGVTAGVSGISINGSITTGNVMLNTGAIVGELTPRLNLTLGRENSMSARWG